MVVIGPFLYHQGLILSVLPVVQLYFYLVFIDLILGVRLTGPSLPCCTTLVFIIKLIPVFITILPSIINGQNECLWFCQDYFHSVSPGKISPRCGLISNSSPGRVRGDDAPAQRLQVPGGRGDCGGGAARQRDDRRSNCYLLSQRE